MRKFALSIVFASGFALLAGCSHDHHDDGGHSHDHSDTQDTDTQKDKKTHQNTIK